MNIIKNPTELSSKQKLKFYTPIAMLFVSLFLVVNIVTQKVVPIFGEDIILTAGDFVYPLNYAVSIILVEVYGYAMSRRVIWVSFFCNFIVALIILFTILLPSNISWHEHQQYANILGRTPRILFASFVAFLIGEFIGTYILAKIKVFTIGKYLFLRIFSATIFGQLIDSAVFGVIAFYGILNGHKIMFLVISAYLFKIVYQIIITPIIGFVSKILKKHEHLDIFDQKTDFNPFKCKL